MLGPLTGAGGGPPGFGGDPCEGGGPPKPPGGKPPGGPVPLGGKGGMATPGGPPPGGNGGGPVELRIRRGGKRINIEGTYHRGIHRADPFQEAAFHQEGMGAHLEASWEEILGLEGMEAALWNVLY